MHCCAAVLCAGTAGNVQRRRRLRHGARATPLPPVVVPLLPAAACLASMRTRGVLPRPRRGGPCPLTSAAPRCARARAQRALAGGRGFHARPLQQSWQSRARGAAGPPGRPRVGGGGAHPAAQRGDGRVIRVGAGALRPGDALHLLLHLPARPGLAAGAPGARRAAAQDVWRLSGWHHVASPASACPGMRVRSVVVGIPSVPACGHLGVLVCLSGAVCMHITTACACRCCQVKHSCRSPSQSATVIACMRARRMQ